MVTARLPWLDDWSNVQMIFQDLQRKKGLSLIFIAHDLQTTSRSMAWVLHGPASGSLHHPHVQALSLIHISEPTRPY